MHYTYMTISNTSVIIRFSSARLALFRALSRALRSSASSFDGLARRFC